MIQDMKRDMNDTHLESVRLLRPIDVECRDANVQTLAASMKVSFYLCFDSGEKA